jgi:tetratricopeptide (TPR) repeat protein
MPLDIEQSLKKARQLIESGNHEESRLCLLELLKEEPDNQTGLLMLGGAYFSTGKLAEAEMVFERLILQSPSTGEYSIALFNTLWKLERNEEAFEEIRRFMAHADQVEERETIEQYIEITKNISGSGSS